MSRWRPSTSACPSRSDASSAGWWGSSARAWRCSRRPGGASVSLIAGLFAATAVFLLRPAAGRLRQGVDFAVDFAVVAAFAFLCDPAGVLWRAPERLEHVFTLTPVGASVAVGALSRRRRLRSARLARGHARGAVRAAASVLPADRARLAGDRRIGRRAVPRLRRARNASASSPGGFWCCSCSTRR